VRERRGSYNRFCCRLHPFICWIIIKEGPGNFSGGRSPHWVNHVNRCLSCIVCLLCFCFCICFILLLRGPVFLTKLSFIRPKDSSQEFLISLAHSLFSDILCSHALSKILPWVCSGMESLELLTTSFFVAAITSSWKATRADLASLSLKEMSSRTWSTVW
jgi:hypothetical protein